MSVYKDEKTGTWRVVFRYKDWTGENRQTQKRGFQTKREAIMWECEQKAAVNVDLNMKFGTFVELYYEDMKSRIRLSTLKNKECLIEKKILPYFKNRKINSITPRDIVRWQNELMNYRDEKGKPYAQTYLKTINNQISAIFNHAVNFYGLKENPVRKAGSMGKKEADEMLFWTTEEYEKFAEAVMDNPRTYYAFELLYWCGIREGELLALTPADFDFENNRLSITKSYQRIDGKDIITPPKTQKSIRVIDLPEFLAGEIQDYMKLIYDLKPNERLFKVTKSQLYSSMKRGAARAGVKKIRVHDLRHSHISLLIQQGFTAVDIGNRVGHEAIDITYRYAHMFPDTQKQMAENLNNSRTGGMTIEREKSEG